MAKSKAERAKELRFHCSIEWHLISLGATAIAVYNLAYRVAKKSGVFSGSTVEVGKYFGARRQTIGDAFAQLEALGFVEEITNGKSDGESNTYRVLSHKEWAAKHPGQCCEKVEFPFGHDELGKQLYAASGGKVMFRDFQMANYKKTGQTDEQIVQRWKDFLATNQTDFADKKWRKSAGYHFWQHLKFILNLEFPDSENQIPRSDSSDSEDALVA